MTGEIYAVYVASSVCPISALLLYCKQTSVVCDYGIWKASDASYEVQVTQCGWWWYICQLNLVNIGLGNGSLPDGTEPLPEPMLTNH